MKALAAGLAAALLASAVLAGGASADSSSFSETQSAEDQLFHIDIGASFLQTGQPPRESNSGVGTIRISLPGAKARFDGTLPIDQTGYSCSVVSSAYGVPGEGFICSSNGQVQGNGLAFANAVVVHLLSQDCYAPPVQGSAQPAVADVWAAPGDPGTQPDASFPLYADAGCGDGAAEPDVDPETVDRCVVPKLKNVTLPRATLTLSRAGCKRGKVKYVYSRSIKKGRVLKQSVKAGRKVKPKTKVALTVSLGKKPKRIR